MSNTIIRLPQSSLIRLEYTSSPTYNTELSREKRIEFCDGQMELISDCIQGIHQRLVETVTKSKAEPEVTTKSVEVKVTTTTTITDISLEQCAGTQSRKLLWQNRIHDSHRQKAGVVSQSSLDVAKDKEDVKLVSKKTEDINHFSDHDNLIIQNLHLVQHWWSSRKEELLKNDELHLFPFIGVPITDIKRQKQLERIFYRPYANEFDVKIRDFWIAEKAVATHNILITNCLVINAFKNEEDTPPSLKALLTALNLLGHKDLLAIATEIQSNGARECFRKTWLTISAGVILATSIFIKVLLDNLESKETVYLAALVLSISYILIAFIGAKWGLAAEVRAEQLALRTLREKLLEPATT